MFGEPKILKWIVQGELDICIIGKEDLTWLQVVKSNVLNEEFFKIEIIKDLLPLSLFGIAINQYQKFNSLEEAKLYVQETYNNFCKELCNE